MDPFKVNLEVSPEFVTDEIAVKTSNPEFGSKMVAYLHCFSTVPDVLSVKTAAGYKMIAQKEILYLEAYQREITIHQKNEETIVKIPLTQLLTTLDQRYFVQVSKSVVINLRKLTQLEVAFSGNYYGFIEDKKVVISRRYLANLKRKLTIIGGSHNETT